MGHWVVDIEPRRLTFLLICTLLDPRLLALNLPLLTEDAKTNARAAFVAEYDINWAPAAPSSVPPSPAASPSSNPPSSNSPCGTYKQVGMGSFVDYLQALQAHGIIPDDPPATTSTAEASEAEKYLEMAPASHDVDVLHWWATNSKTFPHLSRMARQFLSVPATSASAERVFSLAGRVFSDLTQDQNDTTLEDRMWAKVNRKQVIE